MGNKKYDDEFRLEVVKTYYSTDLGVRKTARYFGLPTKNYVTRWIEEFKAKGLIPTNQTKEVESNKIKQIKTQDNTKSTTLKQLEKENLRLRAENDFLKKVSFLQRGNALQK